MVALRALPTPVSFPVQRARLAPDALTDRGGNPRTLVPQKDASVVSERFQ